MPIFPVFVAVTLALTFSGAFTPAAAQHLEPAVTPVPAMSAATVAVRTIEAPPTSPILLQQRGMRRSTTLMIVGGAIFLAGALIGDDAGTLIMIGGAATALYGLYIYLDREAADPPPALPAAISP